jgi:broad specificity phosphatase PhoE
MNNTLSQQSTTPPDIGPDQTLVYLVRHGETSYNVERRFQGQLDVPLSETGLMQARAVAEWLAGQPVRFAAVYSSDLRRAFDTASIVAKRLGLVAERARALREIHVGEWQGLGGDEIEERFPGQLQTWSDEPHLFTMPGGESLRDVQARMLAWYEEAVAKHRGEAIIIVSHGVALSTLVRALNGWDLGDQAYRTQTRHGNTGVSVILADHERSQHRTTLLNSLVHLGNDDEASLAQQPDKPVA